MFKPFHQIFLSCVFLTWNPVFLPAARSRYEVGKDGEGRYQTIGEGFFSLFCQKKLKMEEPDGKRLEML
jgi:hypothetical protein